MSAHTTCHRPVAAPELRLAPPAAETSEPAEGSRVHGLFDRLFDAWAERVEKVWRERGWRDVHDLPHY